MRNALVERLFSDLTTVFTCERNRGIKHMAKNRDHNGAQSKTVIIHRAPARGRRRPQSGMRAIHPVIPTVKARCDNQLK